MARVRVQFADAEQTSVVTVFGCEQDPEVFQHLGEVNDDDERFLAYIETLSQHVRSTLPSGYEDGQP